MVLQTTGIPADTNADGAVVNVVIKEGGNAFNGVAAGFFSNNSMESANLTQELQDRPWADDVEQDAQDVGPVAQPRWPDQAQQDLVLRSRAQLGLLAVARWRLLEPEHVPGRA
jgi:hypothetical protein